MEGPVNGQIYATVNSIKTESELEMMKSPSPNILDANNHRSSHGHHYIPQRSPNSSLSPRPNPSHHQMQPSDPDQRYQREERNHSSTFHGARKMKEHEQSYHQANHEAAISKRVAPMWSPSSDISTNYRDTHGNSTPQQKQVSHRSATQAEIDKLDDLLQELTPRLNDSPSEYSRRRRQSFSSTSKTGAYEGRSRQDTFIQGFSPTSPIEAQEKGLLINDTNDPQQQQQQQLQQQMMITASLARAPLVERSNSQSNLEMTPRHARNTNWHSEEKKRLQRTRSLLDEKDKYLTEQLRRIQARSGVRDIRDGSAMSPIGRPGSSQQILSDMVARYNSGTSKEYASDWEEVRLFSDQHSSSSTRRATSEMEYPLRDLSVDRRINSPVIAATSRRRPLIRHYSDRDEFSFTRQRHNSDNHASRTGPNNRSYSPITNYRHLNGSPAQPDLPFDAPDDIPLMQRRNLRTNIHSARLPANNLIGNESSVDGKIRERNIESLPVCHVPKVGGPLSPMTSNVDLPMIPVANLKESERARATPELLNKTRNSGFQIRADNSTRASGISYHDPDEAYLSSDSYPIVSRLTLSQSPSEQQGNNKIPPPLNQRRVQHVHHRSEEMSNQNSTNIGDRELDNMIVQDSHNTRSYNATVKSTNPQSSQNSSLRKSAKIWYQPNMSREEAVKTLKGKPPGSFVVRQSHTFNNSYGLAVNVPRTSTLEDDDRCVRHFLIESNTKGVRIRGCSNEPYFGSLTALVHQHTLTKLALPCCLVLPISESDLDDQQSSYDSCNKNNTPKVSSLFAPKTFSALYLGSIDTESLTGAAALNKAVEILLENKSEVKQTEVSIRISPEGLTLTDVLRKLFFRRHYPLNSISYCGTENSTYWDSAETRSRGFTKSKIFGFVARKTGTSENMCHLLCEWHPQDNARAITNFISCCVPGT